FQNGGNEARDQVAFRPRNRGEVDRTCRLVAARMEPGALVVDDHGPVRPEGSDDLLVTMDGAEIRGHAADQARREFEGRRYVVEIPERCSLGRDPIPGRAYADGSLAGCPH